MLSKLRNKRGFTLIEMVIVIAVVAVLVSVVMVTTGNTNDRAKAATNAANLRSVESQLATLLVTNPEAFEKDTEEVDEFLDDLNTMINNSKNTLADARQDLTKAQNALDKASGLPSWLKTGLIAAVNTAKDAVAGLEAAVISTEEYRDAYVYRRQYAYYAENGEIQLNNGFKVTAPESQQLAIGGLKLSRGTQMMVIVSENEIIASYEGLDKYCFGIVAGEGEAADVSDYGHDYVDADGNKTCDICGDNSNHNKYEIDNPLDMQ